MFWVDEFCFDRKCYCVDYRENRYNVIDLGFYLREYLYL